MPRALSLIALGATLFMASANGVNPSLALGTIRAVDTPKENKDSWSVKGATIEGVDFDTLEGIVKGGKLSAELVNFEDATVDTVAFEEEDCKFLPKERGVVCKIKGARISIRLFTSISRTKAAALASKHEKTKTGKGGLDSTTTIFWKAAASAKGREFEDDLTDAGLTLRVAGLPTLEALADDCTEKTLANGQTRLTCVPEDEE
jgi:hypothetical protein